MFERGCKEKFKDTNLLRVAPNLKERPTKWHIEVREFQSTWERYVCYKCSNGAAEISFDNWYISQCQHDTDRFVSKEQKVETDPVTYQYNNVCVGPKHNIINNHPEVCKKDQWFDKTTKKPTKSSDPSKAYKLTCKDKVTLSGLANSTSTTGKTCVGTAMIEATHTF